LNTKTRWGILGTGKIANAFAHGLVYVPDAQLIAVGSRNRTTAHEFGERFHIPHRHSSYEELAADPDVDVVYVSSPHPAHCANTLLCLQHNKAVLCEKPFAIHAGEAQQMIELSRKKKIFLMEAMWTRFLPAIVQVREWLRCGEIGEIQIVMADFGFHGEYDPNNRLFNPDLGGGALLDVGIYPISFTSMVMNQPPTEIVSQSLLGKTKVDEMTAVLFRYPGGELAILSCSNRVEMANHAYIFGRQGQIQVSPAFWRGQKATLKKGNRLLTMDLPYTGNGYAHEAIHVQECLQRGLVESSIMPLDESLQIMQTIDRIRAQIQLIYPMEHKRTVPG